MSDILDISHLMCDYDPEYLARPFLHIVQARCIDTGEHFQLEVALCLWCLHGAELSKKPMADSYASRMKHIVEHALGRGIYISAKAFDIAASIAGVPRRLTPHGFIYAISANGRSFMARKGSKIAKYYLKSTEFVTR